MLSSCQKLPVVVRWGGEALVFGKFQFLHSKNIQYREMLYFSKFSSKIWFPNDVSQSHVIYHGKCVTIPNHLRTKFWKYFLGSLTFLYRITKSSVKNLWHVPSENASSKLKTPLITYQKQETWKLNDATLIMLIENGRVPKKFYKNEFIFLISIQYGYIWKKTLP